MKIKHLSKSKFSIFIIVFLIITLPLVSCTSFVVITPPYPTKLRVGDGVKLLMKDGTVYSGRTIYLDQASIVIRTPKQIKTQRPVEVARFGTTVPWAEVVNVKVSGTLDSQKKLISNEEIRINHRSHHRRNMLTNFGILGTTLSFLGASFLQDQIAPTSLTGTNSGHTKGRIAFWSTFVVGSTVSAMLGYKTGQYLDRRVAITRIERFREQLRQITEAAQDSLKNAPLSVPPNPSPPPPTQ